MQIPSLYLIIAGQVALILVFLIGYLIYLLVSEENRWETYTDKLKSKIRELQEYKDRFDIVSSNLHKQIEQTEALTEENEQLKSDLESKNSKITELEALTSNIEEINTQLAELKANLEEKEVHLEESNETINELKTRIEQLEEEGAEYPEQINGLNITIEQLETDNNDLKVELTEAKESISQYQQSSVLTDETITAPENISHNDFDLLSNLKERYEGEMERLKKNYNNQKHIIDDLEAALIAYQNNSDTPLDFDIEALSRLQQMLNESNTVVEMLEGEIDTLQAEIDQLMMQNEALMSNQSNQDDQEINTQNETPSEDINVGENTDDIFFSDTAEPEDEIFFDDNNEDSVFFDIDTPTDTNIDNETQSKSDLNNDVSSEELEQLKNQLDGANQMAMTMMMTSGDQGNIINFARNSITYESLEELGKGILETVSLFQVNGALQLRGSEQEPVNLSSYGKLTAQDTFKISDTTLDDRFEEDGQELLIRFDVISLLIKGMPLDDADKMGRIKDNMAIALELACANLNSIEASIRIKKNQKVLNQVLKNTYNTIQNVEEQFNEQNTITNQVINSLIGIISNPAMTEGMDPIYKDVFINIINDGKDQFDSIKAKGVAIDGNFSDIVRRLGSKIMD